jgi:hypothetical protein
VFVRSTSTSNSQVTKDVLVRPGLLREVVKSCIDTNHPAFTRNVFSEENTVALEVLGEDGIREAIVVNAPTRVEDCEAGSEDPSVRAAQGDSIYGPDARHVFIEDPPAGVNEIAFLRDLARGGGDSEDDGSSESTTTLSPDGSTAAGTSAVSISGLDGTSGRTMEDDSTSAASSFAAAASGLEGPSRPRLEDIQPRFPAANIVNEYDMGRRFFMLVFPQHFTNGKGGLDEADPDLTEAEFLDHAAFWHTRQFSMDAEFCAVSCTSFD